MIQRHIFEVIVVNHSDGAIIASERQTATSSEAAMAKLDIKGICEKADVSVDDVEYSILKLGSLRPVQEVKQSDVSGL